MALFGLLPSPSPSPIDEGLAAAAAAAEVAHAAAIRRRWDAYHGRHPRPLRVREGQPDDTVILNLCRVIVDKGVSALMGDGLRFEVVTDGEEAPSARSPAEAWLEACWAANRQATLLHRLALSGAIAGHAWVRLLAPDRPGAYPRLVVLDPATVSVQTDPHDYEAVLGYRIQYPVVDPETGRSAAYRQRILPDGGQWRVVEEEARADGRDWRTIREIVWPHPWPPLIDTQNLPNPHEYWGLSDLEDDVLQLNHSLNFVLSNVARIIRYHAHPKTWGRGFSATQLNVAVDETIVLPSPDAELRNLEMQSDLASSLALAQRLREALHEVTRIPEVATGKLDSAGALSGVALQILYQPLIEKTQTKRRLYGDLLVELNRRLLTLGGYGPLETVIHWPEPVPSDPLAERQAALLDQQLGVSQDTLLARLGYDPEHERAQRAASGDALGAQLLTAFDRGR